MPQHVLLNKTFLKYFLHIFSEVEACVCLCLTDRINFVEKFNATAYEYVCFVIVIFSLYALPLLVSTVGLSLVPWIFILNYGLYLAVRQVLWSMTLQFRSKSLDVLILPRNKKELCLPHNLTHCNPQFWGNEVLIFVSPLS